LIEKTIQPGEPVAGTLGGRGFQPALKRAFVATRPKFYPASAVPVVVGTACGVHISGTIDWLAFVIALVTTILVHAASNVYNDVGDEIGGTDRANVSRIYPYTGGSRVIQNEVMTVTAMRRLAWGLFGAATLLGLSLVLLKGPMVLVFGLAGIALGAAYSMPAIRLSGRGLGELAVGIAFGIVPVLGATWLQSGVVDAASVGAAVAVAAWVTAILTINEVPDMEADAATGKRTIPVRMGVSGTRVFYLGLQLVSLAGALAAVELGGLTRWWALPALLIALMAVRAARALPGDRDQLRQGIEATLGAHTLGGVWLTLAFLAG
jgi:1,4-dihydroxy-2-naphthoate octaprenyltransferase